MGVTGKWTSTSEEHSSLARCLIPTLSSSGPRPGTPNLSTGTSMRGKRLNGLLMTKLLYNHHRHPHPPTHHHHHHPRYHHHHESAEETSRTTAAEPRTIMFLGSH